MAATRPWRQYLASIVVDLTGLAQGMAVGWPSPVLPSLQSSGSPLGGQPMSDEVASWLGSLLCLGGLLATPLFMLLYDRLSRKLVGYLVALPSIAGWALLLATRSEAALLAARFVIGLGCGANLIYCPLYVTEISQDSVRGSLGTIMLLMTHGGIVVSYVVGSYVSYTTFNLVCLAVPLVFLLAFFWMPESPVYLVMNGREEEARRCLVWLRSGDPTGVDEEIKRLAEQTRQKEGRGSFLGLFSSGRGILKATAFTVVLAANVEFTGQFAVVSYTVTIFIDSGVSFSPYASTILAGTLMTAGVLVATALIDRAGRKVIMLASNLALALCLGVLGSFFYLSSRSVDLTSYGWVPVTSVSAYMVFLAMGVATIPYIIMSETFPVEYKSMGTALGTSLIWFLAFFVGRFFSDLVKALGAHGCFWMFGALCLLCEAFIHVAVPETKGRTLESILDELNGKPRKDPNNDNADSGA